MTTSVEMDSTDKAIISELQVDGRLAYAQLAPRVGLSERDRGHGRGARLCVAWNVRVPRGEVQGRRRETLHG